MLPGNVTKHRGAGETKNANRVLKRSSSSSGTLYVRDGMMQDGWMRDILARRREEGTFRELRTPEQDRCFVDFTSNDFLGLGRAADLRHAIELEAARVRQACCTLRGPTPHRDTNPRMLRCACVCVASSDTALMRAYFKARTSRLQETRRQNGAPSVLSHIKKSEPHFELSNGCCIAVSG